ncbi:hypothetical protein ACSSS7_006845 [Eimeria intestinalis]
MEDTWDSWGSAGIRRRSGVGGPHQGGPPEGPLEAPSRQSTGETLEAPADEEEAPRKRRGGPSSFALVSCYTATLSVLFLACAIGGCFLGIYISKPQLKAAQAGTDDPRTLLSETSPAFKYRQRFGTPSNGTWVSLATPDNEVHVPPSEGSDATTTRLELPWRVGLRIPENSTNLLKQLKPLADDCDAYGAVVLGLEVTQGFSRSFLSDVEIPGAIHVVQAVTCSVSEGARKKLENLDLATLLPSTAAAAAAAASILSPVAGEWAALATAAGTTSIIPVSQCLQVEQSLHQLMRLLVQVQIERYRRHIPACNSSRSSTTSSSGGSAALAAAASAFSRTTTKKQQRERQQRQQ